MKTSNKLKGYLSQAWAALKVPIGAVILGLLVGAIAIIIVGLQDGLGIGEALYLPLVGYYHLFMSTFGSLTGFGEMLVHMVPLVLTGLSVSFAFRCGLFNIGAEGQFLVGLFAAAYVGFTITGIPAILQMLLAIIVGALAGALWGGIVGWLKAKRGLHVVITSIMFNYIAFYVYNFFVGSPEWFKDKFAQGSRAINPAIKLPRLGFLGSSRANWGVFIAILAVIGVYILLWKTKTGFEVRAVGNSEEAARYAGINVPKNFVIAMSVSGLLSGLAGAIHLLGTQVRASSISMNIGYGLDGIAVSLIGQQHPVGVVAAAFLMAVLKRGATYMQAKAGIAKEVVAIVQAAIIFFVAADMIVKWIYSRRKQKERGVESNE